MESPIWDNPVALKVFLWCIMRANHKATTVHFNGQDIDVPSGAFVSGRQAGARACGVPESTFRNVTNRLEKLQMISTKKDSRKTLYSVVKYSYYQAEGQPKGQKKDSRRTAEGQPVDTDKNVKNEENEKKENELRVFMSETATQLGLLRYAGFADAWREWIAYRSEIRKPLTERMVKSQMQLLATSRDPADIIRRSIANGYIGLFVNDKDKRTAPAIPFHDPKNPKEPWEDG